VPPYFQTELLHRDGRQIAVELAVATLSHGGKIVGRVSVVRDIRRRLQVQAEMEQRRRETEILGELARSMNASLDLDTVLRQVAAGVQVICQSDVAILGLQEPNTDDVILRYWAGVGSAEAEPLRVEAGKGLGGQVMVTGQPIRTDHYATDARFGPDYLPVVRQRGTQAMLAVPIRLSGRVVGLLYAANRTPHPFTDRDEAILLQLADHAAGAIRNAQLYQELDAFVYTASHDLKAPLVSIGGYAAILHQEFHAALGEPEK
jgi:GAF domain-containing protein